MVKFDILHGQGAGWPDRLTAVRQWFRRRPGPVFRLSEQDGTRLFLHYATLPVADRHQRFHGRSPYGLILERCQNIDFNEAIILGQKVGRRLIGVVELLPSMADDDPAYELAVSVLPAWQHQGVALALVQAALDHVAQVDPLRPVVLFTETDNQGMLRICRKLKGKGELMGGEYRFLFRPSLRRSGLVA